jgi:hypothetical protein
VLELSKPEAHWVIGIETSAEGNMAESEDLKIVVEAFDEAQRLLRAHDELSPDAAATVERLGKLLAEQKIVQALERTRLRSLRQTLIAPAASSTHT